MRAWWPWLSKKTEERTAFVCTTHGYGVGVTWFVFPREGDARVPPDAGPLCKFCLADLLIRECGSVHAASAGDRK